MSTFQDPLLVLVAYSDGELSAEAIAALEVQLANSADLRNRLEDVRALQASLRTHLPAAPTQLDHAHRRAIVQIAQPLRVRNWWAISRLAAACLALGLVGVWTLLPKINMVREGARKSTFVPQASAFSVEADMPPTRVAPIKSKPDSLAAAVSPTGGSRFSAEAPGASLEASLDGVTFEVEGSSAKFRAIGAGDAVTESGGERQESRELEAVAELDAPEPENSQEGRADTDAGTAFAWKFKGESRAKEDGKITNGLFDEVMTEMTQSSAGDKRDGLEKKSDGRVQAAADRPANGPQYGKSRQQQNGVDRVANKPKDTAATSPASPPVVVPPAPLQLPKTAVDTNNNKPRRQSPADSKEHADSSIHARRIGGYAAPVTAIPLSDVIDQGFSQLRDIRAQGYQYRVTGDTIDMLTGIDQRPNDPTATFGLSAKDFQKAFGTQPMVDTQDSATLTCAFTADTASFDRAASLLGNGTAVDAASIQAEHFVNATPLDYPAATGPEAFSLYAEAGPSPFAVGELAPRTALVSVGAVARPAGLNERRPLALTLAIDCSGSMAQSGGLERIQAGLRELVSTLGDEDTVAIVAFGDRARIVLPATSGTQRERLLAAIAGLQTGGSTNAGEGLTLAYQLAAEGAKPGRESRVLLATDGATLSGDGAAPIVERIAADRARGISLIVVGCGERQYEGTALDALAAKGDGQHLYVGSNDEARELFRTTLQPKRLGVLARDAKVQVTWNPQRVSHARLIGYETRRLSAKDFRDDRVDAGEIAHDTQATALFEVILTEGSSGPLGSAAVRYFDTRLEQVRELACPLPGSLVQSRISPRMRLLACSADLAELLSRSFWANQRGASYARLLAELERCSASSFRDRLRNMAEQAQHITGEP